MAGSRHGRHAAARRIGLPDIDFRRRPPGLHALPPVGHHRPAMMLAAALVTGSLMSTVAPGTAAVLTDQATVSSAAMSTMGTYDQRVRALNPTGYWRLNDAAVSNGAVVADASGNSVHGSYATGDLRWQSTLTPGGPGYRYVGLGSGPLNYVIQPGDRFEYDIISDPGSYGQGIDFGLVDGGVLPLRDQGYVDQHGRHPHPALSPNYPEWTHRVITFAPGSTLVGRTVGEVWLVNESYSTVPQGARFANIRFTDSAGNIKRSIWAPGNPAPGLYGGWGAVPASQSLTLNTSTTARTAGPLVAYGGSGGTSTTFGGNSDSALITSSALDMAAVPQFSVEMWVKSDRLRDNGSSLACRNQPGLLEQYCIDSFEGSTRFYVRRASDNAAITVSGPSINDGQWHHLVGVYDNGTLRFYIDGTLVGTTGGAGGGLMSVPAGTPLRIGSRPGARTLLPHSTENGVPGAMAEVAVYKRALAAAEIVDHWTRR